MHRQDQFMIRYSDFVHKHRKFCNLYYIRLPLGFFMLLAFILVEGCQIHAGILALMHLWLHFFSLKLRSKFNDLYVVVCEAITKKFENHSWWFLELTSVDGHWWWFCFHLNSSVQFFTKDLLCISSNCQCGILSICIFFFEKLYIYI